MRPHMEDCVRCKGRGYIVKGGILFRCDKCGGRGELDWVEQVTRRRNDVKLPSINQLIDRYKSEHNPILKDWENS
jgi:RecJ-like exonuclease